MLLRYIDSRRSVACFKKIQVIIYVALTSSHILQDWRTLVHLLSHARGSPSVTCSGFWRILIQGRFSSLLLCEVPKRRLPHRPSQSSVPLRREWTVLRSLHLLSMWSLPRTQRVDSENVSYLLCLTCRAEEIQRKTWKQLLPHTCEGDGSAFCCLRKPMTSHRVEHYHPPDSLCALMASFVLSCRHFGPARLNIALVLTPSVILRQKEALGLWPRKNILTYCCQFFHFFLYPAVAPWRSTAECFACFIISTKKEKKHLWLLHFCLHRAPGWKAGIAHYCIDSSRSIFQKARLLCKAEADEGLTRINKNAGEIYSP